MLDHIYIYIYIFHISRNQRKIEIHSEMHLNVQKLFLPTFPTSDSIQVLFPTKAMTLKLGSSWRNRLRNARMSFQDVSWGSDMNSTSLVSWTLATIWLITLCSNLKWETGTHSVFSSAWFQLCFCWGPIVDSVLCLPFWIFSGPSGRSSK